MAEQPAWNPIESAAFLAVAACAVVWVWIIVRWRQGRPVAPYQPRRPVPWHAIDLVLILAFYLTLQAGMIGLAGLVLGEDATEAAQAYGSDASTTEHIVGQLIAEGNVWVFLLCVVSAAIVAPAAEEFFFRVLLQGWLESVEHRWRRWIPSLRRLLPHGFVPIVLTSLLFARLHFRVETPQMSARFLIVLLAGDAVARVLSAAFAVGLLRRHVGATAADLGWTPGKTAGDVKLGLTAFLAVAAPVYAMHVGLRCVLPQYIAPDPFPLFFFALALGVLYYRTHRILPVIVLHAVLNGTSLALVWLGS